VRRSGGWPWYPVPAVSFTTSEAKDDILRAVIGGNHSLPITAIMRAALEGLTSPERGCLALIRRETAVDFLGGTG